MIAVDGGTVVLQGVVSGVVVLVGVVTAEWLSRLRDRRRELERAALELANKLPFHLTVISDAWKEPPPRPDTSIGSRWANERDRIVVLIGEIRVNAKWPVRHAGAFRAAANDLVARLFVADRNWLEHRQPLTDEDAVGGISAAPLVTIAMGKRGRTLEDEIEHYTQHGFSVPRSECERCADVEARARRAGRTL